MSKSSHLRLGELRDVYRLLGDCRDLGADPVLWQGHMLEGLTRLIGAAAASSGEGRWRRPGGAALPASAFSVGFDGATQVRYREFLEARGVAYDPTMNALSKISGSLVVRSRTQVVTDGQWYRCALFTDYLKPSHLDHSAYAVCQGPYEHAVLVVGMYRGLGERDFSDRERQFLRFFHGELGRLVGTTLKSVFDPDPLRLPRRERQTLACLLEGDSEKQVAGRLAVSPATAHQYVMSLYRRFGVRSRAELLAWFLRRYRAVSRYENVLSFLGDDGEGPLEKR